MKYCSDCGQEVISAIPSNDIKERFICTHCHKIHYQNPNIITGVVANWGDRILLCRRAIEPRKGFWCLPAGFMENGESTEQGAEREAKEETFAQLNMGDLYVVYNLPHINQVYMYYRAELTTPEIGAGRETYEAALFSEDEIPWQQLAYPTIASAIKQFYIDHSRDHYPLIHQTVASQQQLLGEAS